MPRGFLPWGLSNTCPQDGAMRPSVACDGQVSDNPKQLQSSRTGSFQTLQLYRDARTPFRNTATRVEQRLHLTGNDYLFGVDQMAV